ncbi:dihydroneopterin aldolase [Campylobacter sp.]|uniref:dihydroneopterin aldolase n=1 Tax=Campylobacter sp. TaxID=205 RepID=UPI002708F0E4|nr:dihydroneopterin aldolase [Campylobacter sp.]
MISTVIKDYEFETIIGMLEFERTTRQRVRLNVEFGGSEFIDYVEAIEFIKSVYNEHMFQTVENSLEVCSQRLKERFNGLKFLKMEILKTEIVQNALVGARLTVEY